MHRNQIENCSIGEYTIMVDNLSLVINSVMHVHNGARCRRTSTNNRRSLVTDIDASLMDEREKADRVCVRNCMLSMPGASLLGVGVGAFICVIHGVRRVAAATLMAAKNHP